MYWIGCFGGRQGTAWVGEEGGTGQRQGVQDEMIGVAGGLVCEGRVGGEAGCGGDLGLA
jgi:hypothetical protein